MAAQGQPAATPSHDFPEDSVGKAVPYGIYDITANAGWVSTSAPTTTPPRSPSSRSAAGGTRPGRSEYPQARRLLITADAGGSNGYRTRAWKAELAALAVETGLEITVCHFPPGTSKWNKVEHRLFSHITMNWRGRPLTSHEVVVQTIAATTTRTGLRVHAELDDQHLRTGVKVSDRQMDALPLTRHDWHGDWNYTLRPEAYDQDAGAPDRFDQPSPDLAWLCHPALTGLPAAGVGRPDHHADDAARPAAGGQPGQAPRSPPPAEAPRVPAAAPSLPWQTGSWPPSCTTAWPCPRSPSPPCSASGPKPSTSASATSASSWTRPGTPSSPARTASPALTTSTALQDRQASLSGQRSRQRVNYLQALN